MNPCSLLSPRPFGVLLGAVSLLTACRIYVDQPATGPAPPPPAPRPTYATQPPPPPHRYVRRPPPAPPASGAVATSAPTEAENALADSPGGGAEGTTSAGACYDAASSPMPDCAQVHLSGSCAGASYAQQKCAAYKEYFDAKVASDAVACLGTLGSKVCDQTATNTCGRTSLAKACIDRSLNALCGIAATKCKASQFDCTSLLSGLNDEGKEKIAACIAAGCTNGLAACVDALLPGH